MFNPQPKKGMPPKKIPVPLKRTPIKKKACKIAPLTKKQQRKIQRNKNYYRWAIAANIAKNNGKCICEECGTEIPYPTGANVSHIVAGGANNMLYDDPINHEILCKPCEDIWTNGERSKMRIFPETEAIREELNLKHYTK